MNEIIQQHKVDSGIVDALVFLPSHPKFMVINFTGMNHNKFERWSWYYEYYQKHDDTIFICLKDEEHLFYLNRKSCPEYIDDIRTFIMGYMVQYNITPDSVMCVGSSIGGWASIFYSSILGLKGAVVSNPLVDKESAELHKFSLWTRKMNETGEHWVELDEVLHYNPTMMIYLSHGNYPADESASKKLVSRLEKHNIHYIEKKVPGDEHADTIDSGELLALIDQWKNF